MNKQSITGLVVIFLLLVGYSWWAAPSKEEVAKIEKEKHEAWIAQQREDSAARAKMAIADSVALTVANTATGRENIDPNNPFSAALIGETVQQQIYTRNHRISDA